MIKEKLIWVIAVFLFTACSNENINDNEEDAENPTTDSVIIEQIESADVIDVQVSEPMDSVQEEAYKNDLSLEIKPIKEEIEDPISDECGMLLEEYASAIKMYDALLKKIDSEPDNVSLMIERAPMEENLDSYATKPQFFNCSQNKAFKKQFDILNGKKDQLLYN
jgi:hypothetical protein